MLEVHMKTSIKTLFQKGYNKTQIAKLLQIDRKTVRKILNEPDKSITSASESLETSPVSKWPSILDEHKEFIEIQMAKDLSITRIHQDLMNDFGISVGYTTVRDYVARIRKTMPKAYMVLHSLPGEEAQVDFGYIGLLHEGGKRRKAWVFVMSLSYSRYMYAEITSDQSVRTFILCHIRAFMFFGGVPQTVKIDNLKAAIIEADFYEPTVQRTYADFAAHYGFLPNPCRVYTPTDKGKIESNVKYIKDNCFKARGFNDINEARTFLKEWLLKTANLRKHGTTGKVPAKVFNELELKKLLPLPSGEFVFSKSKRATVWTDCHFSYGGNYYSAPHSLIGCEITAMEVNGLLKIYHEGREIALHALAAGRKGEHITDRGHYPSNKNITHEEVLLQYQEKMGEIGANAAKFFSLFKETSAYRCNHFRSISGILSLRKKYGDKELDLACGRAVRYGNLSYRAIKNILEKGLYFLPLDEDFGQKGTESAKIRDLSEYRGLSLLGAIENGGKAK